MLLSGEREERSEVGLTGDDDPVECYIEEDIVPCSPQSASEIWTRIVASFGGVVEQVAAIDSGRRGSSRGGLERYLAIRDRIGSEAQRDAAQTSSSSSGGSSATISSVVMPSATIPTTVATGMRSPRMHGTPPICRGSTVMRSPHHRIRTLGGESRVSLVGCDGRPVYGMGGLGGLGGRTGGQETTSGDWDGLSGGFSSRCQGEGRGFESRRPLHIRPAQRAFRVPATHFTVAPGYTIASPAGPSRAVRIRFMLVSRGSGWWLTVSGRGSGSWATVAPVAA